MADSPLIVARKVSFPPCSTDNRPAVILLCCHLALVILLLVPAVWATELILLSDLEFLGSEL